MIYKSIREKLVLKNGVTGVIFQLIPLSLMLVCIPFYLEFLDNQKWSITSLSFTFLMGFLYFDMGISKSANKLLSALTKRDSNLEKNEILFNGFILNLFLSLFFGTILSLSKNYLLYFFITENELIEFSKEIIDVIILSGILLMNISFFRNVYESTQNFFLTSALRSITLSAIYFPIIALIFFKLDFISAFKLIPITYSLIFTFYFIKATTEYKFLFFSNFNSKKNINLLKLGISISSVSLLLIINNTLDRQFIALYINLEDAVYYLTSQDLISKINTISGSIGLSLMPMVSSMNNSKQEIFKLFSSLSRKIMFLSIFLLVVFILIGDSLLSFWIDTEYSKKSFFVSLVLLTAYLVNSFSILLINIYIGQGELNTIIKIELFTFILYILMLIGFSSILTIHFISFIFLIKCVIEFVFLYYNFKKGLKLG